MSEHLGNFLVDLACNPQLMAQFLGDPEAVLAQTALSRDERNVVLSRDPRLVSDALGSTGYALGEGMLDEQEPPPPPREMPGKKPGKKKTPRKPPAKKGPAKPSRKAPARKAPAKKAPSRKKR